MEERVVLPKKGLIMIEKTRKIKEKFELTLKISDPEIIADNRYWQKVN